MKEQNTTPGNGDKQSTRCRVQNTVYKDSPETQWILQQHKKDLGRNEGYTNRNKEQFMGNQQQSG